MQYGQNYASKAYTSNNQSSQYATAQAAAITGKQIQVVGFDGSSSTQPFRVKLIFGSQTKLQMRGSADTSVGRDFYDIGPIAPAGSAVSCEIQCDAAGDANANLIWRVLQ